MVYQKDLPPEIDLRDIKDLTKVAMFVGKDDDIGDVWDARHIRELLLKDGNDALVFYREQAGGHSTFMVGKDMSYLKNVLFLLPELVNFS